MHWHFYHLTHQHRMSMEKIYINFSFSLSSVVIYAEKIWQIWLWKCLHNCQRKHKLSQTVWRKKEILVNWTPFTLERTCGTLWQSKYVNIWRCKGQTYLTKYEFLMTYLNFHEKKRLDFKIFDETTFVW